MSATSILTKEHELIKRGLGVLEVMSRRLEQGQPVPSDDIDQILSFIRSFADKLHHAKEEDVLFPALLSAGSDREIAMIMVILCEHDEGRALVRRMAEASGGLERPDSRQAFVAAARSFVAMLRDHICKEDEILFRVADEILAGEREAPLTKDYAEHEARAVPEGPECFHVLIERLEREYLPPPAGG